MRPGRTYTVGGLAAREMTGMIERPGTGWHASGCSSACRHREPPKPGLRVLLTRTAPVGNQNPSRHLFVQFPEFICSEWSNRRDCATLLAHGRANVLQFVGCVPDVPHLACRTRCALGTCPADWMCLRRYRGARHQMKSISEQRELHRSNSRTSGTSSC